MTPSELAQEYEEKDFDYFLDQMLDAVPENIDKREGSIIYDALAPAAAVMGQQALDMANLIKESYIKTADGEFLDYRAVEHGTERYQATQTEVKAKFTDFEGNPVKVEVGDQFASVGESPIFYTVTKVNADQTGEMQADEPGTVANSYLGQVLPVTPNDALSWAEITEIIAPARDVETDDHLRERLLNSTSWIAYGGNVADYIDMLSKIDEVGAGQVYPVWNGPGTVKLVIVDNSLMPASASLCEKVKERIDPPDSEGKGIGLAPIDHTVTVVAPTKLVVNISTAIKLDGSTPPDTAKSEIKKALESYFATLRKSWNAVDRTTGRGYSVIVYRSRILSQIMAIPGVINATVPTLNGAENDIALKFDATTSQLPVLGEVTLNG